MNIIKEIQKAEKNIQTYQTLINIAQGKYDAVKNADDGLDKNFWKNVEVARERSEKDINKLLSGKRYWVKKLFTLEKQLKQSMISH